MENEALVPVELVESHTRLLTVAEEIVRMAHQAIPRKGQFQSPHDDYIIASTTFKRVAEAVAKAQEVYRK